MNGYKLFHTIEAVRNTSETSYKAKDIPQDLLREINDEILKAARRGEYSIVFKTTMFYTLDTYENVVHRLVEEGYYATANYDLEPTLGKIIIEVGWGDIEKEVYWGEEE